MKSLVIRFVLVPLILLFAATREPAFARRKAR
jgi:hypothetical protein